MPTFDITQIPTTYIVQNPTYPYYSNNVKFTNVTTNGKTYLNLTANGTPFPAKAGNNPTDTTRIPGGFTNDGTTAIVWVGNPFELVDQQYNFFITYRGGTNSENPEKMEMGVQGMFANGVALYNPSSGTSVPLLTNLNFFNTITRQPHEFCAVYFESFYAIDNAGGHCSPQGNAIANKTGQYHYHDDLFLTYAWNTDKFFNSNSYYRDSFIQDTRAINQRSNSITETFNNYIRHPDGHSKIVGICFDGYPIYGPYGYSDPENSNSDVEEMTSSYVLKDTAFIGRPYSYTDTFSYSNPIQAQPPLSITIGPGAYMDDYTYVISQGSLDEYNGRYCVTPEYPNGTYAYFTTGEHFPFIIGNFSKNKRNTSIDTNIISTDIPININKSTNINYFTMKSVFSNNSQIYYKPGSLSSGITSVRNARHKSKYT